MYLSRSYFKFVSCRLIPVILEGSVCQQGLYLTKTIVTHVSQMSTEQCGPGLKVCVFNSIANSENHSFISKELKYCRCFSFDAL